MGTPEFALPSLSRLIEGSHEIIGVITTPDRPKGRGMILTPSPVKVMAREFGIEVLEPDNLRDNKFIKKLSDLKPDIIAVVAYGKILPQAILSTPGLGSVNLHPSLLPRYRGPSPIQWAIWKGERTTGVTTILMSPEMDKGDILMQKEIAIGEEEDFLSLEARLANEGGDLLQETVRLLEEERLKPTPQDDSKASYVPMIRKNDGIIDWKKGSTEIINQIRALNPWPGTYTTYKGMTVKIFKVQRISEGEEGNPGKIMEIQKDGIRVASGKGDIIIIEVQPQNRKKMSGIDFVKGYRLKEGEFFE